MILAQRPAPAVDAQLRAFDKADAARRLWAKDPALWKSGPVPPELVDRLGWLEAPRAMAARLGEFAAFGRELKEEGVTDAVVLGMGGSSLFPDLLARTFAPAPGSPRLRVVDTTFPDSVLAARRSLDLSKTVFLVASKSGSTVETASLYDYFRGEAERELQGSAGSRFVAITDPGTPFERQAKDQGLRRVFLSPADVGGRFSALTPFGLVPAAALGLDVERLLAGALRMAVECGPDRPASMNPGFQLGAWLGEAAKAGRDKLALMISPGLAAFAGWVEQLVAESTGKEGKGLLPVVLSAGEPDLAWSAEDHVVAYLRLEGEADAEQDRTVERFSKAGAPALVFNVRERADLGAEVLRWEIATAVAGMCLGINPFDQPNVQETKELTKQVLAGPAPEPAPASGVADWESLAQRSRPGDYLALNAFLPTGPDEAAALKELETRARRRFRRPTVSGFGPRYLHSTGQLHKGGADRGVFLILTARPAEDAPVPGRPYTFARLVLAQAQGDLQALKRRGRRAAAADLGARPAAALAELAKRW